MHVESPDYFYFSIHADFDDLEITVTFDRNAESEDIASFILPIADDDINEPNKTIFSVPST